MNEQQTMIHDCEARESRMSEWECDFIASLQERLDSGRRLTKKQEETLTEIWEKVTENG